MTQKSISRARFVDFKASEVNEWLDIAGQCVHMCQPLTPKQERSKYSLAWYHECCACVCACLRHDWWVSHGRMWFSSFCLHQGINLVSHAPVINFYSRAADAVDLLHRRLRRGRRPEPPPATPRGKKTKTCERPWGLLHCSWHWAAAI